MTVTDPKNRDKHGFSKQKIRNLAPRREYYLETLLPPRARVSSSAPDESFLEDNDLHRIHASRLPLILRYEL